MSLTIAPGYTNEVSRDQAVAGTFYIPHSGDTLSHIALRAYGSGKLAQVQRINRSKWNRANCVYRQSSTKCTSAKANSAVAMGSGGWNVKAWLALCPPDRNKLGDQLGTMYPIIWIPDAQGSEPTPAPRKEPELEVKQASFPWWMTLIIGTVGVGAAYYLTKKEG